MQANPCISKWFFEVAKKAGYCNGVCLDHVPFGLVLRSDGKKFRTRSGDTERLIDLLNKAVDKAKEIIKEREFQGDDQEILSLAKALGIGSIKYADLSCHRLKDYVFNYDRMLKFDGNTAAFLMYAYVRISGIKRKVGINIKELKGTISLQHPAERALALHLLQFVEALNSTVQDLLPNRLTDYLYTLAEKFNVFFRDCRVEGSDEQNSRLLLSELVARVLKQGMDLLGLTTVDRM